MNDDDLCGGGGGGGCPDDIIGSLGEEVTQNFPPL